MTWASRWGIGTIVLIWLTPSFTAQAATLWSVDFQERADDPDNGFPPHQPTMSGVDNRSGLGNHWNAFEVLESGATNPSLELFDSDGQFAATPVSLSLTGKVGAFGRVDLGPTALDQDYLFMGCCGMSSSVPWTLSGLQPGGSYTLYLYGGGPTESLRNSLGADFSVDTNGDGSLANEPSLAVIEVGPTVVPHILASPVGSIMGLYQHNGGDESEWAGLQLLQDDPFDIRWASASSGEWDTKSDWAPGLVPSSLGFHQAVIDPSAGLTVTGPDHSAQIRSLTVSGENIGALDELAELRLLPNQELAVDQGVTIRDRGQISGSGQIQSIVTIETGGQLLARQNDSLAIGFMSPNEGLIQADGGSIRIAAPAENRADGVITVNDGSLTFLSGLTNRGRMEFANSNISGPIVGGTGTLALAGTNSFDDQLEGDLTIDIVLRDGQGDHDRLLVEGRLALSGNLNVTLGDNFMPELGDRFDLLDFNVIEGSFDTVSLVPLDTGLGWDSANLLVDGTLSVVSLSLLTGDLDFDGDVDFDDVSAFVLGLSDPETYTLTFGRPPETHGDTDADGDIDFDDIPGLVNLLTQSGFLTVPEPSALVMVTICLPWVLTVRIGVRRVAYPTLPRNGLAP